jgi:hypothetical protein
MRKNVRYILIIIAFFLPFSAMLSFAQTQGNDDKLTEEKALKFYNDRDYSNALPLYSQLLSLYPKDEVYNLNYAACLIETNQQVEKALKYLQYADSKSKDPMIKYYIGRSNHLNYHFTEAIESYNAFKQSASSSLIKELHVDKLIEMCKSGQDLIKYISDLTVVDNRRIKSENYFYSYDLKEFDGKLVIKPKELKSSIDKKEEAPNMVIFLPNNSNVIYYGSYGTNKANGRDIYKIERLPDNKWSKPENLGTVINTPFDEDFPFLYADGKTLYFSSKGHNSMGGYDIFKSVYDSSAMSWTKPENLDFPINTPYDDYLYITDKDNFYAYFTSNRETRDNNITVYKIIVDKNPVKREYKDLEEVVNTSKLEMSSLADIKKAEESKSKSLNKEQNPMLATSSNGNNVATIAPYVFKPLTYNSSLTSKEVIDNLRSDNEQVQKKAKEINRQSRLAYITAKEKNEMANNKRKQAYEKNEKIKTLTDPVEVEQAKQEVYQLIDSAEELESKAVTSYDVAQKFEQIANEMDKDVSKSKNLTSALESQPGNVDEAIVDAANKNKERLELSQNKYSSLQKEFNERKNLQQSKENELQLYERIITQTADSAKQLNEQIEQLQTKQKQTTDETEKTHLNDELEELNKQTDNLEDKEIALSELKEKTKTDVQNLKNENEFITQLAEQANKDTRSYEELNKEPVNKDQLKKEIYDKELSADIEVAKTIQENVGARKKNTQRITTHNKEHPTVNQPIKNTQTTHQQNVEKTNNQQLLTPQTNETANNQQTVKQQVTDTNAVAVKSIASNQNPLLPTNNANKTNVEEKFQKEQYNVNYYNNIINDQQQKLDILNNAISKTHNKDDKQVLQQQLQEVEDNIKEYKTALAQSQQKITEYKSTLTNQVDTNTLSNEELVLKASKYDNKYEINFSETQRKQLNESTNLRQESSQIEQQLRANAEDINKLQKLANSLNDPSEKKAALNDLDQKTTYQSQLFHDYTKKIDNANQDEKNTYVSILKDVRNYNVDNENVKTAMLLEKEIDALRDKSNELKKEALVVTNNNEKLNLYKKADAIEQISIQKQKYAIDLYVSSKQALAQNNTISQSPSLKETPTVNDSEKSTINKAIKVDLSPEESGQISAYQSEQSTANTKLEQGKSLLKEVAEQKQNASQTYSATKKKELLKDVDKKEQKAINLILDAHNMYETANQKKYDAYQSQVNKLLTNEQVNNDNKAIARQFLKESDFYYTESQKLRQDSKSAATQEDKISLLNKALELESKSLANQEYAVDALTNSDPVMFVATNNLTKLDHLEALDQVVNTDDVVRIKTDRIISNLNLSEADKTKLDEANSKRQTVQQLNTEADKYESKLNLTKQIAKNSTDDKEKKKAEKLIPKLEKEYFSRKFTAEELTENENDNLYAIYENKFPDVRKKDKSPEAKQGKQLEKNANKFYTTAKQLREKSFVTDNPYLAYNYLLQADSLEKLGIEEQEKAYGIYLNLKPLDDEIKEYAETHPKKHAIDELIVQKKTADITPITVKNVEEPKDTTNNLIAENSNKNQSIEPQPKETANETQVTKPQPKETTNETQVTKPQPKETTNETQVTKPQPKETTNETQVIKPQPKEVVNKQANQPENKNKTTVIPAISPNTMGFSYLPASPYSKANPIPVNSPLPEGLVFKVQIGAFNTPVKSDAFKGLAPVTAEKLEGSKYFRYFVGMFYSESAANLVRDYIRPEGYKDAFVVAFYNGKRIALFEARQLLKKPEFSNYQQLADDETKKIRTVTSVTPVHNAEIKANANANANEVAVNQPSNGEVVNNTKELFYTVQIGVYKNPVSHEALKNLTPLYEDHSHGFIRYMVGKFNNHNTADAEKNKAVQAGIADAFVSAYYNGQKITLAEAANIEAMNPKAMIQKSDEVSSTVTVNQAQNQTNTEPVTDVDVANLIFRVQVGSFKEKVPFDIAAKFIQISGKYGIDQQQDETGTTVYYAGKFKSYDEAIRCKNDIAAQFKDAFVIATDGKKHVPVNQAKQLLHQ